VWLSVAFICLIARVAQGATITLAWDPNPESDIAGYVLSYGTASAQYTGTIDVGNVTTVVFTKPDPTKLYYFAVQAYNTSLLLSNYSSEAQELPPPPAPLTVTTLGVNLAPPQLVGTTITFTATAIGGTPPYQYKWWISDGVTSTIGQDWAATNIFAWTPVLANPNYTVTVWARNAASTIDSFDNPAARLSMSFGINPVRPPSLTAISPASGPANGGTAVTLTGTNFAAGAAVTFGGISATGVSVASATSITAVSPAHAAGTVDVIVTNPNGQASTLSSGFTYSAPPPPSPTIASVAPASGPAVGGTAVTITGTNFVSGASVTLGGTPATGVVVVSSTSIQATTPAHAAGVVDVAVTLPSSQTSTLPGAFTYSALPQTAIAFVQVAAAVPQSSVTTVNVSYPSAQIAGNLNIVVVGWNNSTSNVLSVQDSAGNLYARAIGPTTSGQRVRQSIYYAANVRAGGNTVTVTFNQSTPAPDVRVLEYAGVSALDGAAGASGRSRTSSTGFVTTTSPNELIFAANTVATPTSGAGAGFTSRIITSPDGDIAEDRIVAAIGSYNATAPLTSSGRWVMQIVTFK